MAIFNKAAPNTPYYTPAQEPPSGTALEDDQSKVASPFRPLKIRGVEFPNRIWLSPLCQYSSEDGHHSAWHIAHLGGIISRGPGLAFVEATSVTSEGRITPEDSGIYLDSHIQPLKNIVDFAHSQGQKIGIQLAHAGRKASTVAPWLSFGATAEKEANGWPNDVWGPSAVPYNEAFPKPKALTLEGIQRVKDAYATATKRALAAGFDVIEIHAAHGYLFHEFLSPISNKRTDEYGGSFENRARLLLEVAEIVRGIIPNDMPLFTRVSGTDWVDSEPSWDPEQTVKLAGLLAERGVDFLDVSSGGLSPLQKIKAGPGFQAPFAAAVKKAHSQTLVKGSGAPFLVSTVGMINDGALAKKLIDEGSVDAVMVGRGFQKNPGLVWTWADELGVDIKKANQIEWGFKGRGKFDEKKSSK